MRTTIHTGPALHARQALEWVCGGRLPHAWRAWLVAAGALALFVAIWLNAAPPGHLGYDFRAYLAAGRDVAAGHSPYARLLQQSLDTRPGAAGLNANGYVYPPLLATILALPIRLGLSDGAIWLLWNLGNAVAMLWMGFELHLALRGRRSWSSTLAGSLVFAVAALVGAVAMYDLYLGQCDLLMAALGVGACGLWLRRNPWAPLVLGAAIAVKPTMALLMLVWLYKRDWRSVLRAGLAGAALVILPFALIGVQALANYLTFMVQWNGLSASAEEINQSPYGMLLRLFTVNAFVRPLVVAPWLVAPLRLLAVGGSVAWWLRSVPRDLPSDRALALGECLLALPLILLVGPFTEDIHFCLLLPALVGLCYLAYARGLARTPAALALAITLAALCIPRMQDFIYPDHLFTLPGQSDPRFGWLLVLARTSTLLYTAVATLLAGGALLRAARILERPDLKVSDAPSLAVVPEAASPRTSA